MSEEHVKEENTGKQTDTCCEGQGTEVWQSCCSSSIMKRLMKLCRGAETEDQEEPSDEEKASCYS